MTPKLFDTFSSDGKKVTAVDWPSMGFGAKQEAWKWFVFEGQRLAVSLEKRFRPCGERWVFSVGHNWGSDARIFGPEFETIEEAALWMQMAIASGNAIETT